MVVRLLGPEVVDRLRASPGYGLVGGDADAAKSRGVVQGGEDHRQRNRAAVGIGDDSVVLECALAVDLGNDERDTGFQTVRRRLVDADRASLHGMRHELLAPLGSDREETDVEIAGAESGLRRLLDLEVPEPPSGRAPRTERTDVPVTPVDQELERDAADGARRTDDPDPEVLIDHRVSVGANSKESRKTLNRLTRRPAGSVGATYATPSPDATPVETRKSQFAEESARLHRAAPGECAT